MNRIYEQGTHKGITFFIGTEVEHTPMHGERTLFVVGTPDKATIVQYAVDNEIKHIYCGANQSFDVKRMIDGYYHIERSDAWENMVSFLLKAGFWVTLDIDIEFTEWMLECSFSQHNRFIPMLSAKIPYIDQLNYNACLKLDDKDFDKTNPGVWTHRVHDLKDKQLFTDWSKYTQDEILDKEENNG